MNQDILDLPEEKEKPKESDFLKVVGVFRLLISLQILYTLLIGVFNVFNQGVYASEMLFLEDLLILLFAFLVNILFIYYLLTQGINEIKFQHLIHQRKYLKIFSWLLISRFLFTSFWSIFTVLQDGFELGINVLFFLIVIMYTTLWIQEVRYIFTKKQEENLISQA